MNKYTSCRFAAFALFLIFSIALASFAEARPGGGRSSGFRGSRGFGTRSIPSSPYRYQGGQQQQQPNGFAQQPTPPAGAFGNSPLSGGFMRGMLGGLAGGMIGSMLFGSLGRAGGFGGGGGVGFLDILLLLGLGFVVFRFFAGRKLATAGGDREMTHHERLRSVEPGPFAPSDRGQGLGGEHACVETLTRYDAGFNVETFKEGRMDDFMKLQSTWNQRDLSGIANVIAPELKEQLEADIARLKSESRINRIENIAVRSSELIEAWQERGQEFATVRFRANLIDYTLDEATGQVVAGDRSQPVKFEEDWTFVRAIDGQDSSRSWKITAIEANS